MKSIHVIAIVLCLGIFMSCDDSDDNFENDQVGIEEPVDDLVRLSDIAVSDDEESNSFQTYDLSYNDLDLIESIEFGGEDDRTVSLEYAANNRLNRIVQQNDEGTITQDISYDANELTVLKTFPTGDRQRTILEIDLQNRIDRARTVTLDENDNEEEFVSDLRYNYSENFNVRRIDELAENGFTVERYSDFVYVFNNNPFRDMNDVLRFLIFPDFVPYTRYLPTRRIDVVRTSSTIFVERAIEYEYELDNRMFPISRTVQTNDADGIENTIEYFNYLPQSTD
ncbi:hypothetical protein [Nonlabens ponticola]|uniref:DUF4595 domain-containing protein n=1 Tax=Nonlabens ponticola TaxID=2496866 RepID=A0A3S9MUJ7_9FLAO|nr:hypothetical protein [Nonlabens ponticola]AZQ42856.1 hypothetical protein EJ995_00870 [Nonlabens ponticola]